MCYHYDTYIIMKSILVRGLSPQVVAALKRRAEMHHRSLQGELRVIIEDAARLVPPTSGFPRLDLVLSASTNQGDFVREDFYDERGR
jgi:plasmid stability protein